MSYQAQNIPNELRQLPQWVCSGTDKVPINPVTGQAADPMNPQTWGTFEEACSSGKPHIGFVLSKDDPFCIIDLDDKPDDPASEEQRGRFVQILNSIDSYTEISQSGRGIHIVCRGAVESGVKRDKVEIYSWGRYMIFTGNVLKHSPITDQSTVIDRMFAQMKSERGLAKLEWLPPVLSDADVWEMAAGAENSAKFLALWNGTWREDPIYQNDHSSADFALFSMLCFYSRSNEQVIRMFQTSALGQRDKAHREDYILRSLSKIRASQTPQIDLSQLKFPEPEKPPVGNLIELSSPLTPIPKTPELPTSCEVSFPPGLVGEIAYYIYSSSIRPVPHISLAAGIALVAGIAGRAYNVSESGLNHYIILIAGTGRGKEDAARGIDRLMVNVMHQVPVADRFIGPAEFASGQALVRALDKKSCFLSILGEFGITLQEMTGRNAPPALVRLKKALLGLYSKSGFNSFLQPSVYSDSEKNTKMVRGPNVSILGEGSTETFFAGLAETHILDGLIPRFTVIQYNGPRNPRNMQAFSAPHKGLVDRLASLIASAASMEQSAACAPVATDQEALGLLDEFDSQCDSFINDSAGMKAVEELWNRAHLKAWKLAALVAVGCDSANPVVNREIAQWAINFTIWEVSAMANKFALGEVGEGNQRQERDLRQFIEEYSKMSKKRRVGYNVPVKLSEYGTVYPLSYLKKRCRQKQSFKIDRRGADMALRSLLLMMTQDGTLQKVSPEQAANDFGTRAEIYVLGDSWGNGH